MNNGSGLTHNCDVDMREGGNGEEVLHYEDFNQDVIVGSFLLGLRENFKTATEVIYFVSEKVNEIICLETKIRVSMIKESLRRNHDNFLIDYETELIMDCVSPFAESFEKFTGKKSLDEFIQKQKFYVTPTQIITGFDPISQKQEFIQYIPLFSTLEVILQHEDVLSVLYAENDSDNASTNSDWKKLRSNRDGISIGKTVFLVVINMHCKFVFTMMILTL